MSTGPGPGDEQQPPQWQQPQHDQPQWGQQDQPQWGQQQPYQPSGQTPGSATAALILGICSLLICSIICGPLAIVYGNKAKAEIDASGGRLGGRGLAQAGVIMGWIAVGLTIIGILVFIVAIAASS